MGIRLLPSVLLPVLPALVITVASASLAGTADVLAARATCRPAPGGRPASVCNISVTVKHADTGWEHYANRYEIVGPDGAVIATRVLEHPHVDEQPFTRAIGQVRIQWDVATVEIRANDLVHGQGGRTLAFEVPHAKPAAPRAGAEAGTRAKGEPAEPAP